jgi:chromosome segregation ATPase
MNLRGASLTPDDDPDRTDRLPELDQEAMQRAEHDELLETTGSWTRSEVEAAELQQELEQRDAALAELTTLLRQKGFALTRAEKDLDQARSELVRAGQAASRDRAELERRLRDLEGEHVQVSALHDERRVAIAGLEDELSESREREQHLEARVEELVAQLQARDATHAEDQARLAAAEERLLQATRESLSLEGRQEQQRLKDRIAELQNALHVARDELAASVAEGAGLKTGLARQVDESMELKVALAERDALNENLLERLRSREARRRYAADLRKAPAPAPGLACLQRRVVELEASLLAERERRQLAEEPAAGPDEPTFAGEDRQLLLARLAELSGELARRDDRIANLQSDLKAATGQLEGAAGRPVARGESLRVRYLTRIDDREKAVHSLSRPRIAIGRTPDNDLQVRESYISRIHAYIRLGPESAVIEDAASRNGVFVNDRRVRRELLQDGDIVMLGKARFRFQLRRGGDQ